MEQTYQVDLITAPKQPLLAHIYTCFLSLDELQKYFECCKRGKPLDYKPPITE